MSSLQTSPLAVQGSPAELQPFWASQYSPPLQNKPSSAQLASLGVITQAVSTQISSVQATPSSQWTAEAQPVHSLVPSSQPRPRQGRRVKEALHNCFRR